MEYTAVEWLVNELKSLGIYSLTLKEKCEQAKEMEKLQIIEAMNVSQRTDFYVKYDCKEQYYNETFKKDKS